MSQNDIAILATISSTHYLLSTSSKQRNKCSRIELKMSKTKHKQLQQAGGTFAMQLACAAGFLSDAKRINHKTGFICETPRYSGGVTRLIHPHRRSGDATTPNRRMEPDQGSGPLPLGAIGYRRMEAPSKGRFNELRSRLAASHLPMLCHWHHRRKDLSSKLLSPSLRCQLLQLALQSPSLLGSHVL